MIGRSEVDFEREELVGSVNPFICMFELEEEGDLVACEEATKGGSGVVLSVMVDKMYLHCLHFP